MVGTSSKTTTKETKISYLLSERVGPKPSLTPSKLCINNIHNLFYMLPLNCKKKKRKTIVIDATTMTAMLMGNRFKRTTESTWFGNTGTGENCAIYQIATRSYLFIRSTLWYRPHHIIHTSYFLNHSNGTNLRSEKRNKNSWFTQKEKESRSRHRKSVQTFIPPQKLMLPKRKKD